MHITFTCQGGNNSFSVIYCSVHSVVVCECAVGSPLSSSVLTSKQYSCPRMLECTGLMIASSSRVRSRASAALLGESRDSWEWDSLKLCIKRVLGERESWEWGEWGGSFIKGRLDFSVQETTGDFFLYANSPNVLLHIFIFILHTEKQPNQCCTTYW